MPALSPERSAPTTKDVDLLQQLFKSGQLELAPEFQRMAVWPRPAKAYLIDTILSDRPIPLLFFNKTVNPKTGRSTYSVVDGQQRLRAIFEFLNDKVRLPTTEATNRAWRGRKYSELTFDQKSAVLNYELAVIELKNYHPSQVNDIFIRMNKYVVKLNPAELRHAYEDGAFKRFVEELGKLDFFSTRNVFTGTQRNRMRHVEFAAELAILLIEGPQDKKGSIDLYYQEYTESFEEAAEIESRLRRYLAWVDNALPDLSTSRWRRPVDLYALIGALDLVSEEGEELDRIDVDSARSGLIDLERRLGLKRMDRTASRYATAAARQTDNVQPRSTRISILAELLEQAI